MTILTLKQALDTHSLLVLRVIGEWWELDLTGAQKVESVRALAEVLGKLNLAHELPFMPLVEAEALRAVARAGGRVPVAALAREFGAIRPMGPGKLEREEPWLAPESAVEGLWYRGLLYTAFDADEAEMVEYFFIPDRLLQSLLPAVADDSAEIDTTRPSVDASPDPLLTGEPEAFLTAPTSAVDDLTTLLALAQCGWLPPIDRIAHEFDAVAPYLLDPNLDRARLLLTLALEMHLLRRAPNGAKPTRAAVAWLRLTRDGQLRALMEAWSQSGWSELHHTPGLICESDNWSVDPILARATLLDRLPHHPVWLDSGKLIASIHATEADFQRPNGDYNTWYIRDAASGDYLSGFDNWRHVEGRQLRHTLRTVMHWLGMVDVAEDSDAVDVGAATDGAVRLSTIALGWLRDGPVATDEVRVPLVVNADATLLVPHNADRHVRFQAARVADLQPVTPGQPYTLQVTPSSLARAEEQGIGPQRVLSFLQEHSGRPLPAGARRAVERWSEQGVEARLEAVVVLRVQDAMVLDTLRQNPRTRSYIGESLGDLAAVVRGGDWEALRSATAQLGLLLDIDVV